MNIKHLTTLWIESISDIKNKSFIGLFFFLIASLLSVYISEMRYYVHYLLIFFTIFLSFDTMFITKFWCTTAETM